MDISETNYKVKLNQILNYVTYSIKINVQR